MKLNAVNSALCAFKRRVFAKLCIRNCAEIPLGRKLNYLIGMTHKYILIASKSGKQQRWSIDLWRYAPVLTFSARSNFSSEHICDKLHTVANTENRYSEIKNRFIAFRRIVEIDTVRSACKNNTYRRDLTQFFYSRVPRFNNRINTAFSHTPCNQLFILTAEIQYNDFLILHIFNYFLSIVAKAPSNLSADRTNRFFQNSICISLFGAHRNILPHFNIGNYITSNCICQLWGNI